MEKKKADFRAGKALVSVFLYFSVGFMICLVLLSVSDISTVIEL